jgi:hypothetical protein
MAKGGDGDSILSRRLQERRTFFDGNVFVVNFERLY